MLLCELRQTYAEEMCKSNRYSDGEWSGAGHVVASLVDRREHGDRQQERTDSLHPHSLTGGHQRVETVDGVVGPNE